MTNAAQIQTVCIHKSKYLLWLRSELSSRFLFYKWWQKISLAK